MEPEGTELLLQPIRNTEEEPETDITPLRAQELAISEALKRNVTLPVEHRLRKASENKIGAQ